MPVEKEASGMKWVHKVLLTTPKNRKRWFWFLIEYFLSNQMPIHDPTISLGRTREKIIQLNGLKY